MFDKVMDAPGSRPASKVLREYAWINFGVLMLLCVPLLGLLIYRSIATAAITDVMTLSAWSIASARAWSMYPTLVLAGLPAALHAFWLLVNFTYLLFAVPTLHSKALTIVCSLVSLGTIAATLLFPLGVPIAFVFSLAFIMLVKG